MQDYGKELLAQLVHNIPDEHNILFQLRALSITNFTFPWVFFSTNFKNEHVGTCRHTHLCSQIPPLLLFLRKCIDFTI